MKKSQRIQTIIDIKVPQEQKALEIYGASQRQHSEMQGQVNGLTQYRNEYLDRCNQIGGQGIKVSRLVEFRSFIDKLDIVIAGQERALSVMEKDMLSKRHEWEGIHRRNQSLRKVHESAIKTEVKHEHKREQSEQDEFAARFGRHRNGFRHA